LLSAGDTLERRARLGMQALQRTGELADIGSVVTFLASDDACWITGDTIRFGRGSKL
jgi:3-oxoacyl-[acyl-carrier protein] reductase